MLTRGRGVRGCGTLGVSLKGASLLGKICMRKPKNEREVRICNTTEMPRHRQHIVHKFDVGTVYA